MAPFSHGGGVAFVDCHCHLTSPRFDADLDAVLERAERAGVRAMLACSVSQSDVLRVLQLRERYPDRILPCLGLHPLDEEAFDAERWETTRSLIQAEHLQHGITAIGEIGLDFSGPILRERAALRGVSEQAVRANQLQSFEAQVELARELGVPVNVHSRNAERQTLGILSRAGVRGVMHAFKGEAWLAAEAAKAGQLLFSFPPSLVYKREYQEAAKALPLEALLLETDAPSLGAKGPKERNEPGRIGIAAAKLAELKGVSVEEVAQVTTRNAVKLFGAAAAALATRVEPVGVELGLDKKAARWRKDAGGRTASAAGAAKEEAALLAGVGPPPPVPPPPVEPGAAGGRKRWRARAKEGSQGQNTADPTLCSAAYGSAFCD